MNNPADLEAAYASAHDPEESPAPVAPIAAKRPMRKKSARKARDPKALLAEAEEPKSSPDDPRSEREWTTAFDYTDPATGVRYKAIYTNSILSLDDRARVAVLLSQMTSATPFESLPPDLVNILSAIAHLTVSLQEVTQQSPVGWADNLLALDDANPVMALYEEVLGHEVQFRELQKAYNASKAGS